jgi:hypothetical protein
MVLLMSSNSRFLGFASDSWRTSLFSRRNSVQLFQVEVGKARYQAPTTSRDNHPSLVFMQGARSPRSIYAKELVASQLSGRRRGGQGILRCLGHTSNHNQLCTLRRGRSKLRQCARQIRILDFSLVLQNLMYASFKEGWIKAHH